MELQKGCVLVSEPFLEDPNFQRTVVLLVEHGFEGTLGFVLTQDMSLSVQDIFEDFECDDIVYLGGPVAKNTFHYLHTISHLEGAKEVLPGLYWGGDFELLQFYFREGMLKNEKIKFFAGYSGWGEGQLESELKMKSWIVARGKSEYIFNHDEMLWKHILQSLGGEYKWLSNAPDDVQLN